MGLLLSPFCCCGLGSFAALGRIGMRKKRVSLPRRPRKEAIVTSSNHILEIRVTQKSEGIVSQRHSSAAYRMQVSHLLKSQSSNPSLDINGT